MNKRITTITLAIGLMAAGTASAFEYSGYFRAGPGQKTDTNTDPNSLRCFNGSAPDGHGGIGRLGNECHTYGEFGLSHSMNVDGVQYKAFWMPNFYSGGNVATGGSDPGGTTLTAVEQLYVEGKGYDIAPNETFWIGKRFYHRTDVHFDDAFFVNMSGTGAGVDGIALGGASLSLAAFRQNDNTANPQSRFNADVENIELYPGGKLRVTLALTEASGTGGENGSGVSIQHDQANVLGGDNRVWLQYAQGSAAVNMGFGNPTDDSSHKTWLLADTIQWVKGPLSGQALVQFGEQKDATTTRKFNAVGGRMAYALSRNFKLQAELGTSSSKPTGGSDERVTKLTIAPTLTTGPNYYDRPELRLYASYFTFNDGYKQAHGLTKSNISAVGAQVEVWF